jgi:hypothetical protein
MSALNELEAFQDGLSSPFWQHFSKHLVEQWGPSGLAFQQMYQDGISKKDWERVVAANEIQKAMAAVLQYPHERVTQLKAAGLRELVKERAGRGGV